MKKLLLSFGLVALANSAWAQFTFTAPGFTKCIYSDRGVTIRKTPSTSGQKLIRDCGEGDFCDYVWISSSRAGSRAETLNGVATFIKEQDGWYKGEFGLDDGTSIEGWVSAKFSSLVDVEPITAADLKRSEGRFYQGTGNCKDWFFVESSALSGEMGGFDLYVGKIVDGKLVMVYVAESGDYVDQDLNDTEITRGEYAMYGPCSINWGKNQEGVDEWGQRVPDPSKLTEKHINQIMKYMSKDPRKLIYFKANGKIGSVMYNPIQR